MLGCDEGCKESGGHGVLCEASAMIHSEIRLAVKTRARESCCYETMAGYVPPQLRSDCSVDFFVASDMVCYVQSEC